MRWLRVTGGIKKYLIASCTVSRPAGALALFEADEERVGVAVDDLGAGEPLAPSSTMRVDSSMWWRAVGGDARALMARHGMCPVCSAPV